MGTGFWTVIEKHGVNAVCSPVDNDMCSAFGCCVQSIVSGERCHTGLQAADNKSFFLWRVS